MPINLKFSAMVSSNRTCFINAYDTMWDELKQKKFRIPDAKRDFLRNPFFSFTFVWEGDFVLIRNLVHRILFSLSERGALVLLFLLELITGEENAVKVPITKLLET